MSADSDMTLADLLKNCSRGDRKAQEQLFRRFYGYVMSIALRFSGSQTAAEEIVSDVFFKVFTKLDLHHPEKDFKAWLRKIAVNTSLDHNRREFNKPDMVELVEEIHDVCMGDNEMPDAEEIIALLQQLSPMYRTVFNLYVMEGYSHEEISQILGINTSSSRANLSKAKVRLIELFQKYREDAKP